MLDFLKGGKKTKSLLDQFILIVYGDPPPLKTAVPEMAIEIAYSDLLKQIINKNEISKVTYSLYKGKIPYSTNDLALSVALNFFKRSELIPLLKNVQIEARKIKDDWMQQNKVNKYLGESFDYTLKKLFN